MDEAYQAHDHARIDASSAGCSGGRRIPCAGTTRAAATCDADGCVILDTVTIPRSRIILILLTASTGAGCWPSHAEGIREHTRLPQTEATTVNDSQATDITLTVTPISEQNVQSWVRTAGTIDVSGKVVTANLSVRDGAMVQVGQRARAFQVASRSLMNQARITRVTPGSDSVRIEATLAGVATDRAAPYLLEIVIDRGRFLAVPNAAIIEEGERHIVYVQHHPGAYLPMEIHTGIQGELYTQILHGLESGAEVVTFGSFFVDAEYKLKSSGAGAAATGHEHHHH